MTYGTVNVDSVVNSDGTVTGGLYGFKNRIINGAMTIDQRNSGASVTPASGAWVYLLDRWASYVNQSSKLSVQQVSDAPTSFKNSLKVTSLSAYSITSSDIFSLKQGIEGFNFYDFNYGTASAATFTLSFWVKSSLTGTFGGGLQNVDGDRGYAFTYTISSANTWEYKTVVVAGDTSGTWAGATNTLGINIIWGLGVGSNRSIAAGAWGSNAYTNSATGATSVVGTSGATWQITGVQLEKGSVATSFDYRPIGTEGLLCQRYYQTSGGLLGNYPAFHYGPSAYTAIVLPVTMRTTPTATATGLLLSYYEAGNTYVQAFSAANGQNPQCVTIVTTVTGGTSGYAGTSYPVYQASAEL